MPRLQTSLLSNPPDLRRGSTSRPPRRSGRPRRTPCRPHQLPGRPRFGRVAGMATFQWVSLLRLSRADQSRPALLLSEVRRGGHARCQKARRPVRVTREPDGRQLPVYSVLAIVDLTSLTEATTGWSTRQPARRARRGDATQRETWEAPKRETTRAKFTRQSSHAACAVRRSRLGSMRRGTG